MTKTLTKKQKKQVQKKITWDDIHENAMLSPFHWLMTFFPEYCSYPFSDFHVEFWTHIWCTVAGLPINGTGDYDQDGTFDPRPPAYFAIWPRGAAKSTSSEIACVMLGALGVKTYGLYVCESQEQANDHINNIGALLEVPVTSPFANCYPYMVQRMVGKYGSSKGWRRSRLRTQQGFTVDAIGLDTTARGVKLEEDRPNFMVFDDLDSEHDTPETSEKKIKSLTTKLIPAGGKNLSILAIQNLPNYHGVFARVLSSDWREEGIKPADYLTNRIVSGPIPAIKDMEYEWSDEQAKFVITGGTPSWEGMDIDACQDLMDDEGLTAFLSERQHEKQQELGGMFDHLVYQHVKYDDVSHKFIRIVCWVDPAVTHTDKSDAMGICIAAMDEDGDIYILYSWEKRSTPLNALCLALRKAKEFNATKVGIETDQGGDTWISVFHEAEEETDIHLPMDAIKAGGGHGGKVHRASQMLADYEVGNVRHVIGTHETLEKALNRFPKSKPFDLVDAEFWAWWDLIIFREEEEVLEEDFRQEISPL